MASALRNPWCSRVPSLFAPSEPCAVVNNQTSCAFLRVEMLPFINERPCGDGTLPPGSSTRAQLVSRLGRLATLEGDASVAGASTADLPTPVCPLRMGTFSGKLQYTQVSNI